MKLDFNFELEGLDGNVISGMNAGKLLAQGLAEAKFGNATKMWEWAKALHIGLPLELDAIDKESLKSFIENSNVFVNLVKAQLLNIYIK
jgi:hypothetical protein